MSKIYLFKKILTNKSINYTEKLVYSLLLTDRIENANTKKKIPTINLIQSRLGLSRNTVVSCISSLKEKELISINEERKVKVFFPITENETIEIDKTEVDNMNTSTAWDKDRLGGYKRLDDEILSSKALTPTEKVIYDLVVELADSAKDYQMYHFSTLAEYWNIPYRTIQNAFYSLKSLGLIEYKNEENNGNYGFTSIKYSNKITKEAAPKKSHHKQETITPEAKNEMIEAYSTEADDQIEEETMTEVKHTNPIIEQIEREKAENSKRFAKQFVLDLQTAKSTEVHESIPDDLDDLLSVI